MATHLMRVGKFVIKNKIIKVSPAKDQLGNLLKYKGRILPDYFFYNVGYDFEKIKAALSDYPNVSLPYVGYLEFNDWGNTQMKKHSWFHYQNTVWTTTQAELSMVAMRWL